jgi:hypothetical protein
MPSCVRQRIERAGRGAPARARRDHVRQHRRLVKRHEHLSSLPRTIARLLLRARESAKPIGRCGSRPTSRIGAAATTPHAHAGRHHAHPRRGARGIRTPEGELFGDVLRRDSTRNAQRLREEAATKLLGTVLEELDMGVIRPGIKERVMMGALEERGTLKGELTRSFWQFKAFPIAMIARHVGRGMDMPTAGGKAAYIAEPGGGDDGARRACRMESTNCCRAKTRGGSSARQGRRPQLDGGATERRLARHLRRLPVSAKPPTAARVPLAAISGARCRGSSRKPCT